MNLTKLTLLLLLVVAIFSSCTQEKPLHNKRVMVLGNSITQDGRYVDFIEYYLRTNYPDEQLDIISIGLSSETVNGKTEEGHVYLRPCIHDRLENALNEIQPDLVLACYGMNDGLFSERNEERFQAYQTGINELVARVEDTGADIILLTPTLFDPTTGKHPLSYKGETQGYRNPYFEYNEVLREFATWVLSNKDVPVIDLFNYLEPQLANAKEIKADSTFIPDGVHPNQVGHFLMAKQILNNLYPNIEIPEPYPTIKELNNNELFQLVSERRRFRSEGWRNYIGYTRGKTVKTDNIEEVKAEVFQLDQRIEYNFK